MEQQKLTKVSPPPQLLNRSFVILASLLILAASLLLTPGAATAADELWVGGVSVDITQSGPVTGPGISGKVSYDSGTKTLTLENAKITGTFVIIVSGDAGSYGIASTNSLDIRLIGDNSVVTDNGDDPRVNVITAIALKEGKISGPGSLTVETVGVRAKDSAGITSGGNLDITGATLTVKAGAAGNNSFGIIVGSAINITNATVAATGGAASSDNSYGILSSGAFSMDEKSVLVAKSGKAPHFSYPLRINGPSSEFPDGVTYRWGDEAPGEKVDKAVFLNNMAYRYRKYISINDYLRFAASPDVPASKIGAAITPVTMKAAGGAAPYKFKAANLPEGITINENTGVISGTPTKATAAGTATITVTDKENTTAEAKINVGAVTKESGGSGGCNAGFAGMLLLAAVPFVVRRKK